MNSLAYLGETYTKLELAKRLYMVTNSVAGFYCDFIGQDERELK